eukprot:TRINITY_DN57212_c0_g1_i1.p1 TRINITY_DN57212_c0_g1~~TRINITY_DN57212_c0_g1_i1.p1  ORF type:complete len:536 (+),score=68.69 TRINITY_DN57212_c0_g1_i1:129-1736(+)
MRGGARAARLKRKAHNAESALSSEYHNVPTPESSYSCSCISAVLAFGIGLIAMLILLVFAFLTMPTSSPVSALPAQRQGTRVSSRELIARAHMARMYQNWRPRVPNQYAVSSHTPCFHAAVDPILQQGTSYVDRVVNSNPLLDPLPAEEEVRLLNASLGLFAEATRRHPHCPIPIQNYVAAATALAGFSMPDPAVRNAAGGRVDLPATLTDVAILDAAVNALYLFPRNPTLSLYAGFLTEVLSSFPSQLLDAGRSPFTDTDARRNYSAAISELPDMALDVFGIQVGLVGNLTVHPLLLLPSRDLRIGGKAVVAVRALRRLLLAREFASDYASGPALRRDEAMAWQSQWWFVLRRVATPYVTWAVRTAYRDFIAGGHLPFKDPQAIRYTSYNDPIARFMMASHRRVPERVLDMPIKPTYTYFGGYVGSEHSELKPHTDRPQCEYSMSFVVDVDPFAASCPIGLNPHPVGTHNLQLTGAAEDSGLPADAVYAHMRPGDALVFKGRHLVHWRQPIPPGVNCSNVFLHYVHRAFPGGLN